MAGKRNNKFEALKRFEKIRVSKIKTLQIFKCHKMIKFLWELHGYRIFNIFKRNMWEHRIIELWLQRAAVIERMIKLQLNIFDRFRSHGHWIPIYTTFAPKWGVIFSLNFIVNICCLAKMFADMWETVLGSDM